MTRFLLSTLTLSLACAFLSTSALAAPEPDRDALIELALRDDARDRDALDQQIGGGDAALAEARRDASAVQMALDEAIAGGGDAVVISGLEDELRIANERADQLEGELAAARAERDALDDETLALEAAAAGLSDDQVVALLRSTNDTAHNGRVIDLDAEDLEEIAARDLNARQIQSYTKALEERAKFEDRATMALEKHEATGNVRHLERAERFSEHGERKFDRFMGKVDRQGGAAGEAADIAAREARAVARAEARASASEAREAAREARDTRREARDAAKQAARDAREAAREARGK